MKLSDHLTAFAPQDLRPGSEALEQYNVARVKGYLQENLGCSRKEVIHTLGLNSRTVAKAIKIIRGKL